MLDLKEVNLSETRFYQDVLQKGLEQGLQREVFGGAYGGR
jgi:predicted transposase YdaD